MKKLLLFFILLASIIFVSATLAKSFEGTALLPFEYFNLNTTAAKVEVGKPGAACEPPPNIGGSSYSTVDGTAFMFWANSVSQAVVGYDWAVNTTGIEPASGAKVYATSVNISGIVTGVVNHFFISTDCDGSPSAWKSFSFAALPCATAVQPVNGAVNAPLDQAFSWATVAGADSYIIYIGTAAGEESKADSTAGTSITLTNLNYGTTYYWYVLPKIDAVSALKSCEAYSFTTISAQFAESFDGDFPPPGWLNIHTSGGDAGAIWEKTGPNSFGGSGDDDFYVSPHSGAGMAQFRSFDFYEEEAADLITNTIDLTLTGPHTLTFWMYRDNYNYVPDSVSVYINTIQSATGATFLGKVIRKRSYAPGETSPDGWYKYSYYIPPGFNTSTNYLIFRAVSSYGNNMFIDDIAVAAQANCSPPDNVSIINFDYAAGTGTALWNPSPSATVTAYDWELNTTGIAPTTSGTRVTGTSVDLTGIVPDMVHYFYVRSDCDGSPSPWTLYTFKSVACAVPISPKNVAANVPLNETFSWNAIPQAEFYNFYLGTAGGSANLIKDESDTETRLRTLSYATNYFWYVQTPVDFYATPVGCVFTFSTIPSPPQPPNDSCQGAVSIPFNNEANPISGTTLGATLSDPNTDGCAGGEFDDDVWFEFTTNAAPELDAITVRTSSSLPINDLVLEVFEADECGDIGDPATCADEEGDEDPEEVAMADLSPNTHYYMRVYSYDAGQFYQGNFNIVYAALPLTPTNDSCAGAISITAGNSAANPVLGTTGGATLSLPPDEDNCGGETDDDVWYEFSTTSLTPTGTLSITPTGARGLMDIAVEVFAADACDAIAAPFTCSDNTGDSASEEIDLAGLSPNTHYYMRVYSYEGSRGFRGSFKIEVSMANVLPVTLTTFIARRANGVNILNWSATQEINASHFIIERSNNARDFIDIGRVAATDIGSALNNHSFTDLHPVKANNYYRLRTVNRDNSFKISNIRMVGNQGIADVSIYPNPVRDYINIAVNADNAVRGQITITDMAGKVVYSRFMALLQGNTILPISVSTIAKGFYILKIQLKDDVFVRKISKQ